MVVNHCPINLISSTAHTVIEQVGRAHYLQFCGMLNTPDTGYDVRLLPNGARWALDNACFSSYEPMKIFNMLSRWQGLPGCLFAVLPDVVCDHENTLLLANAWLGTYQRLGYPPAFVLQNGCNVNDVPWDSIAAVFVGGDDKYKEALSTCEITIEAHRRGKWVHWGRVGSLRRYRLILRDGWMDSFDSSGFAIHPPKIAQWKPHQVYKQLSLFSALNSIMEAAA